MMKGARILLIAVALGVTLVPLYWLLATSLKSNIEITQHTTLWPHSVALDNYIRLFRDKQFGAYFINSIGITAISVGLALVVGSLAGYSLARFRLWLKLDQRLGVLLFLARVVPSVVIVVPLYLLLQRLDVMSRDVVLAPARNDTVPIQEVSVQTACH